MGFEALGKKLAKLGQDTKTGVQKMGESYQISTKLSEEKKTLERLYSAIGARIYEANADAPLEGMEDEFDAIKASLAKIDEYTEQMNKVKGVACCPECGKPASKGEKFCSECGAKLPDTEDISDKMKQDAKEAAGEAGAIVGDAVDKAMGFMGSVADKADAFVRGMTSKRTAQEEPVDVEDYTEKAAGEAEEAGETSETVQETAEETAEAAENAAEAAEEAEETAEETAKAAEKAEETAEEAAKTAAEE